jgi:hypothetical protein
MSFNLNGTEFASKTAAAISMVEAGKSVKEAAATVGIAYQTVYVNTKGKEARVSQMAKRQAKKLISSKRKYSKAEVARRTGLGEKIVRKMFTMVAGNAPEVVPEVVVTPETVVVPEVVVA